MGDIGMSRVLRAAAVLAVAALVPAGPAWADPVDPAGPAAEPVAAAPDDGRVASSPPETTKSRDGWTLTLTAKDEVQRAIAPLTTALSTREYEVSGVFNGSVKGPGGATPKGVLEVGYQIGCGIDMSTSNGVVVSGNASGSAGLGIGVGDFSKPIDLILPQAGASIGAGVGVSLKPGLITIVPITKKSYVGSSPWVAISEYRIKIDGCVGQSFIRSYATLTKSTDEGDAILSWYGVTKTV